MAGIAAGIGGGLLSGLFGGGGGGDKKGFRQFEDENVDRSQRFLRDQGRLGGQAQSEFFKRSLAFDPQEGLRESSRGVVESLRPGLERNLEFARGQAVGSGRLNTGFFDIDRGRIFEDFNQRVAAQIAQLSLQAQGLEQQNIQGIGRFGESVSNRFTDLLGGSLDRATGERNAEGPGLFSRLLGGATGLIAPGIGSAIGDVAGSFIRDKFGRGRADPRAEAQEQNPGGVNA